MKEELLRIQAAIHSRYGCDCRHHSSSVVHGRVGSKEWRGEVEIWELLDHERTRYCYGWCDDTGEIITVLQIPPVISPGSAVRAAALQAR